MKTIRPLHTLAGIGLFALAYYLAAQLGLSLAFAQAQVSPIWPPTGLAIAVLLRFGLSFWPGVFLGALAANLPTGATFGVALGISSGNALEAVAAAWVLRRFFDFEDRFERVKDVIAFVVVAAVCGTMISATAGVSSLVLGGMMPGDRFAENWLTWWLGDALGAVVVAPMLLTWSRRARPAAGRARLAEAAALAIALIAVSQFALARGMGFRYLVFPPLIWAALRFGQRGATFGMFAALLIAVWHTVHDVSPFAGLAITERLHYIQIFAGVTSVTVLILAAVKHERERARDQLRQHRDELELQVSARTAELEASRGALQDFLDNASDLIQSVDADGRYRFVNRAWRETLGYGADEVAALTMFDVIASGQHGHCRAAFERLMATNEPVRLETEFRTKDGRHVIVEGSVNVRMEEGRPVTTRGVFRDITDRKRVEEQLLANLARDKELNDLKSHFVAMASHELRTPLASLSLSVDFLSAHHRKIPIDEVDKTMGVMREGVRQLRAILDNLLLVGRAEDGKLSCLPVLTGIDGLLRKLADEAAATDTQRHPIEVSCSPGQLRAPLDPQLMRHVIGNLLSNACKYSPAGHPVRLEAAVRDGRIEFTVTDLGIGIPIEDQARLFTFFFRASNVGGIPGSGLGLLVVRHCVEAHGGKITFTSSPAEGTRFTVTLPFTPIFI